MESGCFNNGNFGNILTSAGGGCFCSLETEIPGGPGGIDLNLTFRFDFLLSRIAELLLPSKLIQKNIF